MVAKPSAGTGVWKAAALLLAGGLSGNVFAMITGVTAQDVKRIVKEDAPYIQDKGSIDARFNALVEQGRRRDERIKTLEGDYKDFLASQARMDGKLDTILSKIGD